MLQAHGQTFAENLAPAQDCVANNKYMGLEQSTLLLRACYKKCWMQPLFTFDD
jgi:hypothetical protein